LDALRVKKIKLEALTDDTNLHPAPDPILLLASKAAGVFPTRYGQRRAAGAEPQDDDDWTDLDALAAQDYLEWRREKGREETDWKFIDTFVGGNETSP
jgi:hypothetical protein